MDLQLHQKTVLVTGSERGTGQVIAETLMQEGARVILHCNDEAAYQSLLSKAGEYLHDAFAVFGDISTEQGAKQVIELIGSRNISVDILVNNYGAAQSGSWASSSTEDWLEMYQDNVLSGMRLSRAFYASMKENGWGRIVNLGTIGSHQPNAIMPHYYASKGALATASVSLAKELSGTGITVNTVSPGIIHTEEVEAAFRKRAAKKGWGEDWEEILKQIVKYDYPNPCGRLATRQEVADLVAFICSPRADFINGENIRVDGGAVRYI